MIAEVVAAGQTMHWQQPGALGGLFTLATATGEPVASFGWRVGFGKLGTVETMTGRWSLKRTGVWRLTVTLRREDHAEAFVSLGLDRSDEGTLEFAHGPRYRWTRLNLSRTDWEWQATDGATLIHYANPRGAFQTVGAVSCAPALAQLPELDPLVAVGWYLGILMASGTVS